MPYKQGVTSSPAGKRPMYVYPWVKMGGNLFKLNGVAPQEFQEVLERSARSLRNLTAQEKETINVYFNKGGSGSPERSWEEMSQRTSNQLKRDLTVLMNGFEPVLNHEREGKLR